MQKKNQIGFTSPIYNSRNPEKIPPILQTIISKPARVETADIETWKTAINAAKYGNRVRLYNLYENLMTDGLLGRAIDKRIEAITNAEISFQCNQKSVEAMDDLIDTPEFEELLIEITLTKGWGISVIDTRFIPEFNVFSVPRKNINFKKKLILQNEGDEDGLCYKDDPHFIEIGKENDLGFIFKAAQYVIYKRGGFGDWSQFVEIFGMPFRIGKYNAYDDKTRQELNKALEEMGGAPWATIPKEGEIDIIQNNSNGNGELYDKFRKACNEEILYSVLGNTMTTVNGGSRAQGQVHLEVEEGLHKADRRFVQRILNKKLLPLLEAKGYPVKGGFFYFPDQGENLSLQDKVEMAFRVRDKGLPVDDDYIYEISGVPKPKGKEEKEEKPPKPEAVKEKTTSSKEKDDEKKSTRLMRFFAFAPTKWSGAIKGYKRKLTAAITGKIELADNDEASYQIDISDLFTKDLKEIYHNRKDLPAVEKHLFEITNNALQDGIDKEFLKVGTEFGKKNTDFIDEFKHNTAVFSAFKNHQQTQELVDLLTDENGDLRSWHAFKKAAKNICNDYNVQWLKTEYNTAVRAARQAANFKKFWETRDLYPNLEYIESRANKKRELHLEWVGTILPINHEWWDTHMPPSDWNCFCGIRQTDKPVTEVPEDDNPNPVFRNNPGKTGEFVAIKETPYYKNTPEKVRSSVNDWVAKVEINEHETIIEYKNEKTGKVLSVSSLHGKKELPENKAIGEFLTDKGYNVKLLPLLPSENKALRDKLLPIEIATSKKNPDAVVWGKVFEFKEIAGSGKSTIGNNLSNAVKQSENVLLKIHSGYSKHDIMRALNSKIAYWEKEDKMPVKRIWVIYDGKLLKHTVKTVKEWAEKQKRQSE